MNSRITRNTVKRLLVGAVSLPCLFMSLTVSAEGAVHHVTIEAMKFSPDVLEVNTGDRIVWENKDFFPHNVTGSSGEIHSPELGAGEIWEFIPLKKGTYPYICSLHPTMKAKLIIK